jgi:biotin carboxylase
VRLCLVASKPTDSVILGFLPAAARLGLEVVLLTDQPEEHERARARSRPLGRPGCPRPGAEPGAEHAGDGPPARFLGCDVRDARELICAIAELPAPHAIVSNSDHLQAQTALAAAYFGLPGKDWRSAMRAKNKSLMRRRLAEACIPHPASTT